ncbi:glutamine synthetase [Parabacteroides sp. PF5-5]|uniref:glutamine synthetase III family protein n=1 Tax=unclassified Parabacteroides TaxID=2649774 RepID=UPI0024770AFC|nr:MULTISPECIES: glutamine synthetase III [unclassified Parabacteroides]MDH6305694.1 glutamine synthetase [Parabacteroides sp. PH5-39]MDH6316766.1 glutamine synthetase [Parabacteroides sp. PF5-13]MDH6320407.1 glutamine synthetase [Parabacteroides sp. PH5-13]MDH6324137.1 glutamine synthetase [Parabacteroides sp. PH5-8]MDH6327952.1 glutamine synthetase [Parabacteroides sp. PH5-41]
MSTFRFNAVEKASNRKAVEAIIPSQKVSEYFGENVFNRKAMKKYLSKETFKVLTQAIDSGTPIDREIANHIAAGMKMWALEKGVTHYTHWFQPLTDGTAEKHDAFVELDNNGGMIEEFSGKLLVQQEPDASSFPSGGLRNTFEARGYSAWDPSSPAFIVDDTLCIPTVFIAYTGEALDYKTPLIRSIEALDEAAKDVCSYFSDEVNKVITYLGWEQEYFLVDEDLYSARPDLSLTERTLLGHESAKNQQLDDHYFGAIPSRVQEFMKDLETECYRLGIPVKTRHNEVAPNQFELAPIYEECNLANDHNQLLMSVMRRVSRRHNFRILLHEKPFMGVNGSGKHCNWSLGTDTGINLFSPGKDKEDNLRFITFIVNTLMAVYKFNSLLKASIASASNAYRLGANEAPPAIISSFLGKQITEVLDRFENSSIDDAIEVDDKKRLTLGFGQIPELLLDNTDRNRTSPFAFTGNRFEFRALGSSANCGSAMLALNSAVAFQLKQFKHDVEALKTNGKSEEVAIFETLKAYIKESKPIRFDGNGYSEEWKEEALHRGLDCENSVPLQYDAYLKPEVIDMFGKMKVLSEKELEARNEVKWEIYIKKVQIEARVLGDLSLNHIIPVVIRYQSVLLETISKLKATFEDAEYEELSAEPRRLTRKIAGHICAVTRMVDEMVEARKKANRITDTRTRAIAYHDTVAPYLDSIREHIDDLELMVDNQMWPLPKYRELLFIR